MRGLLLALLMLVTAGCGEPQAEADQLLRPVAATRTADLPPVDDMSLRGRDDTLLHQNDWRQLEFYAADRRPELEQALTAAKASQGIYLRQTPPSVTIAGRSALAELETLLGARSAAAPFLSQRQGEVAGQVYGGFTMPLKGLLLYGLSDYNGVNVLGAVVQGEDGLSTLSQAFGRLHGAHGLVAVDWRSLTLITGLDEKGTLETWRP